mmetsp:Transcript_20856/g.39104  ORF Transcript_20856/g.39104 Transcript_20856/m.39104 type:complete len:95 (-) Transcript_20856:281-565(-)
MGVGVGSVDRGVNLADRDVNVRADDRVGDEGVGTDVRVLHDYGVLNGGVGAYGGVPLKQDRSCSDGVGYVGVREEDSRGDRGCAVNVRVGREVH